MDTSSISNELLSSIVHVVDYDNNGRVISKGTGFVITKDGLIATCSHVVQDPDFQEIGDPLPESVNIIFSSSNKKGTAKTISKWWSPTNQRDICILKINKPDDLSIKIQPLKLSISSNSSGHLFETYGYPSGRLRYGNGKILVKLPDSEAYNRKVFQLESTKVTEGFSGAPLFDLELRRVVGIVTFIDPCDRMARMGENAFAVTSEELVDMCTPLKSLFEFNPNIAEQNNLLAVENVLKRINSSKGELANIRSELIKQGIGKAELGKFYDDVYSKFKILYAEAKVKYNQLLHKKNIHKEKNLSSEFLDSLAQLEQEIHEKEFEITVNLLPEARIRADVLLKKYEKDWGLTKKRFSLNKESEVILTNEQKEKVQAITNSLDRTQKNVSNIPDVNNGENWEATLRLGYFYEESNKIEKAKELFNSVLEIDPNNVDGLIVLAYLYNGQKQPEKAINYYEKAIKIDPDRFLDDLIIFLLEYEGQAERAIEIADEILKKDPDNIEAWRTLGVAYGSKHDHDQEIKCYEEILKIDPDNSRALTYIGDVYFYFKKKYEVAIKYYQKALEKDPENSWLMMCLGTVFIEMKDVENAKYWFEKAIRIDPQNASLWEETVWAYLKAEDFENATNVILRDWKHA